jgi:hypothetical protein
VADDDGRRARVTIQAFRHEEIADHLHAQLVPKGDLLHVNDIAFIEIRGTI